MNTTFSLEQMSTTVNLDSNLIFRQYWLDLMARSMKIKFLNPKKARQSSNIMKCSNSTLQQHRHDINLLSPYRNPAETHKTRQNISNCNLDDDSHRAHDLKRPQMT